MKKKIFLVVAILSCLLFQAACGEQDNDQISEKRAVEFSQLYDDDAGRFSLGGYAPQSERSVLMDTAGFLQNEPVVFHGLFATVHYGFDQERLYQISYEFSVEEMTDEQWAQTANELYTGLCSEFDWLTSVKQGAPQDGSSNTFTWYTETSDPLSMLEFAIGKSESSQQPSQHPSHSSITISILTDIPGSNLVKSSYQSYFKPPDDEMVKVSDWIPNVFVELMYASEDNFTGQVIYDFHDAYLRYGTIKKLIGVQKKLNQQGYSLKVCDAFRPVAAQFKLWEVVPDPDFVADPYNGYSTHSRGNTVDLTLVTLDGADVEMPTEVDVFSPLADRDYSDVSQEAKEHALILQNAMVNAGFKTSSVEWWHYYDKVSYPVAKDFVPSD